MIVSSS